MTYWFSKKKKKKGNDILIKEVLESIISDRIEWHKKIYVADFD